MFLKYLKLVLKNNNFYKENEEQRVMHALSVDLKDVILSSKVEVNVPLVETFFYQTNIVGLNPPVTFVVQANFSKVDERNQRFKDTLDFKSKHLENYLRIKYGSLEKYQKNIDKVKQLEGKRRINLDIEEGIVKGDLDYLAKAYVGLEEKVDSLKRNYEHSIQGPFYLLSGPEQGLAAVLGDHSFFVSVLEDENDVKVAKELIENGYALNFKPGNSLKEMIYKFEEPLLGNNKGEKYQAKAEVKTLVEVAYELKKGNVLPAYLRNYRKGNGVEVKVPNEVIA